MRRKEGGFTLIEILVVVTIIGVLMGMVALIFPMAFGARDETVTTTRITKIQTAVSALASPQVLGWYPPATMERLKGPNGESVGKDIGAGNEYNRGIEALVIALHLTGVEIPIEIEADAFQNTDQDQLLKNPTRLDTMERFELVDAWGNPLAYFSSAEYKKPDAVKQVMLGERYGNAVVIAMPWKNKKTGIFVNQRSFQIFSAGEDGVFNTADDIGNWVKSSEESQ